jgi:hypothetical protein
MGDAQIASMRAQLTQGSDVAPTSEDVQRVAKGALSWGLSHAQIIAKSVFVYKNILSLNNVFCSAGSEPWASARGATDALLSAKLCQVVGIKGHGWNVALKCPS